MLISVPAAFGVSILSRFIIRLFFGYDYLIAAIPFSVMAFVIISETASGIFRSLLIAKNKPKIYVSFVVLSSGISVVLGFIFLKLLLLKSYEAGLTGMAIASLIASFFLFLSLYLVAKNCFKIKLTKSYFIKPLIASLIMAFILREIMKRIPDMNLFSGLILVFLGMLIYFAIMLLIKGVSKSDLDVFHPKRFISELKLIKSNEKQLKG
jgi:stage V sporulation protein B